MFIQSALHNGKGSRVLFLINACIVKWKTIYIELIELFAINYQIAAVDFLFVAYLFLNYNKNTGYKYK